VSQGRGRFLIFLEAERRSSLNIATLTFLRGPTEKRVEPLNSLSANKLRFSRREKKKFQRKNHTPSTEGTQKAEEWTSPMGEEASKWGEGEGKRSETGAGGEGSPSLLLFRGGLRYLDPSQNTIYDLIIFNVLGVYTLEIFF